MLIKNDDIVTLKQYVKMAFTASAVGSMPDIFAAERKFLIPYLSKPVYNALDDQVNSNTITWNELLALCRSVIAPLAVWLDLPHKQAQITDGGITTTVTANKEAAHQWEYNKISNALAEKGMAALEDLLEHLIENASTYTWTIPEAKDSLIKTGAEFHRFVYLDQPHLTFLQLMPLMREVEDHFIKAAIGEDFFIELKDKTSPVAEEKVAILLLKKAIAQFTVVRAVERMPVRITPNGLMASIQNNSESVNPERTAENAALLRLMQSSQREGDSYQVQLMEYLNKKASLNIFKTFFESEYYSAPVITRIEANDYRNGVCALT